MSAVTCPSEWPANATTWSVGDVERVPHDERREQHRELRFARAGERFGRRVDDEVRERFTERGFGPLDDRPRRVVAPRQRHARLLGSLAGEDHCDAHRVAPLRFVQSVCAVKEIRPRARFRGYIRSDARVRAHRVSTITRG